VRIAGTITTSTTEPHLRHSSHVVALAADNHVLAHRTRGADLHAQRHIALMQPELVTSKRHGDRTGQRVAMRPHTNPGAPSVDEKPSVAVFSDRAAKKSQSSAVGPSTTYESNRWHSATCTSGSTHKGIPASARTRSR